MRPAALIALVVSLVLAALALSVTNGNVATKRGQQDQALQAATGLERAVDRRCGANERDGSRAHGRQPLRARPPVRRLAPTHAAGTARSAGEHGALDAGDPALGLAAGPQRLPRRRIRPAARVQPERPRRGLPASDRLAVPPRARLLPFRHREQPLCLSRHRERLRRVRDAGSRSGQAARPGTPRCREHRDAQRRRDPELHAGGSCRTGRLRRWRARAERPGEPPHAGWIQRRQDAPGEPRADRLTATLDHERRPPRDGRLGADHVRHGARGRGGRGHGGRGEPDAAELVERRDGRGARGRAADAPVLARGPLRPLPPDDARARARPAHGTAQPPQAPHRSANASAGPPRSRRRRASGSSTSTASSATTMRSGRSRATPCSSASGSVCATP